MWQPLGKVSGVSALVLVSRSSAISLRFFISLARSARSNSEMARSVPTTLKRPSRYSISDSAASSTVAAIALPLHNLLGSYSEPLREQRDEHAGMALSGRLHVQPEDQPLAAGIGEGSAFEGHAAGMLKHAGKTKSTIFATFGRGTPALLETVVIGERQRLVEHGGELTAVDRGAHRRLVGHPGGLDEVASAQFDRIDAGHARCLVDHALEHEIRLRPSGAAVGGSWRRVGEDTARADVDAGNVVHARQAPREVHGLDIGAHGADIGAHISKMTHAQRQKFAPLIKRKLDLAEGIACVIVAEKRLGSVRHPMHRPTDFARGDQDGEVFRIGSRLQSERAADIFGDDPQPLARNTENRR